MNFMKIIFVAIIITAPNAFSSDKNKEIAEIAAKLTPVKGTTPAQWRITWTGDASTEATISWSTLEEGKSHILYYGTTAQTDYNKFSNKQECQNNGRYKSKRRSKTPIRHAHFHHAKIQNLKPSTKYFFILKSDDEVSRQFYFITAPAAGVDFSIIHGGDSRSGHLNRCKMNLMLAEMVTKDPKIIALAHGGDYINNGNTWKDWRLWLSQHELTTGEDGRVLPVIPTKGNHDDGKIYAQTFDFQSKPTWHTTTLGKDVAMLTLDTNKTGGGEQLQFLEAELKSLRPQVKWLMVQYHKPLYPAVKPPASQAKIFAPVFDKYNVDLACESDGHCIKRTVPIRGGKQDPTGVTYIGEGGLGVGQRAVKKDRWYLQNGGVAATGHHVMKLDFSSTKLRIRTRLLDGKTFDDHSLSIRK